MNIKDEFSDELVLQEMGERLARTRLERNLTQANLAKTAGISKRTLERLESGAGSTQLTTFIKVCRALGLLQRFDTFLPKPPASPVQQLKLHGRKRKRASGTRIEKTRNKKWTWGESS
jgi:transcriptional regulator with XRE-family HTH domain